jgi:vacuolar-type H+-ATPase subunit I/STV1
MTIEVSGGKTRKEYNGSYPPGVKLENVNTVRDYNRSLPRCEKRQIHLYDEYKAFEPQLTDADSIKAKSEIIDKAEAKLKQVNAVSELIKQLEEKLPKLEDKERDRVDNYTFQALKQ